MGLIVPDEDGWQLAQIIESYNYYYFSIQTCPYSLREKSQKTT